MEHSKKNKSVYSSNWLRARMPFGGSYFCTYVRESSSIFDCVLLCAVYITLFCFGSIGFENQNQSEPKRLHANFSN